MILNKQTKTQNFILSFSLSSPSLKLYKAARFCFNLSSRGERRRERLIREK